jgi:hypothetical protein
MVLLGALSASEIELGLDRPPAMTTRMRDLRSKDSDFAMRASPPRQPYP